ncbi:MAG: hypothetical protein HC809_07420, partial [Gammaproteobacteria bacterium]|nr:hypothetical protein [Gammaproteobacteria bacterium]
MGTGHAMRTVGVLTVAKFVPLLALIAWGLPTITPAVLTAPASLTLTATDFGAALVLL